MQLVIHAEVSSKEEAQRMLTAVRAAGAGKEGARILSAVVTTAEKVE